MAHDALQGLRRIGQRRLVWFHLHPVWQIVEVILRYKIKPQQPPIAGLSDAEKACFNWPSIVAFAARNDASAGYSTPAFFFRGSSRPVQR
jgi:hypothetical protein